MKIEATGEFFTLSIELPAGRGKNDLAEEWLVGLVESLERAQRKHAQEFLVFGDCVLPLLNLFGELPHRKDPTARRFRRNLRGNPHAQIQIPARQRRGSNEEDQFAFQQAVHEKAVSR